MGGRISKKSAAYQVVMISRRFLVRTNIAEREQIPVIENSDLVIKDCHASTYVEDSKLRWYIRTSAM